MPFGKHKGKTMFQILKSHPDYLAWAASEGIRPAGAAGEAWDEAVKHMREEESANES
jgi:uncharacterized protein (DUF3820 family)